MAITMDDVSRLAKAMNDADDAVKAAEDALKAAKERARVLHEETVPAAMQELGLNIVGLDTGEKITLKQEVYASIPKANKTAAFQWLEDNDFGSIIKTEVSITFGKGEFDAATEKFMELQSAGLNVSIDQNVHAGTLKAFLKEQISNGNAELPLDLFGAMPVWEAKITKK